MRFKQNALRWLFFTFLFFLLCGFQTSFWPFVVSFLPSPALWLIALVFVIMRFPLYQGLFFSYFLGLCLTRFTILPLKIIWISFNLVYVAIWTLKNRIRSSSLRSFGVLNVLAYFLFTVIQFFASSLLEANPTRFHLINLLLGAGLIFIFSIPLYLFMDFIDDTFFRQKKQWTQNSTFQEDETL